MSDEHAEWTDLLSAYLDGELDPVTRRRLERHLDGCEPCRAVLDDLRRIVAAAPGYRGTPPSEAVWTGIRASIGGARVVPIDTARTRRRFGVGHLIAAGLVMALAGSATIFALLRSGPPQPVRVAASAPDDSLAKPVNRLEVGYDAAVAELQATLAAGRDQLDTATVRVLEQSLEAIDRAIAEARTAIQRDSTNGYLNGQIVANMRKKVNLLRLATRALASET